jgi:hypothetical protein
MPEKETVFSSKVKYDGIFSLSDFYPFCHDWLQEETGLDVVEDKYKEKLSGESKEVDIEWTGGRKLTDFFKFEMKVTFAIKKLTKVEVVQAGAKVETNEGSVEIKVKGNMIKDYMGRFETSAFKKFLRDIYEKWVITSAIEQIKAKIAGDCDEFLSQAKAYLDLEGRK